MSFVDKNGTLTGFGKPWIPSWHQIQSDIDYVGAFLFEKATGTVDPDEMTPSGEDAYDGLTDAPPAISGYREANVAGMACWNCGHFTCVTTDDDGTCDGICNLFEAKADGNATCDRFVAHADMLRQGPHTSWQEDLSDMAREQALRSSITEMDYSDDAVMNTLHFAVEAAEEKDGLIWKDILRTGTWQGTPTKDGVLKKVLRIVRDGESSAKDGVLSLAELVQNFDDGAVQYVTVPLSDDIEDHKNIARLNTGYVKKLKLVDRDGLSVIRAGFDFTEPDVKEKVLRGTIPDVSAGVPFGVTRRADNKTFGAVLDHVCLTRKPYVNDLGPFSIAAADGDDLPIEAFEPGEESAPEDRPSPTEEQPSPTTSETENEPGTESEPETVSLSHRQTERAISQALLSQLRLSPEYLVTDVSGSTVTISHRTSHTSWEVPFKITNDSESPVIVGGVDEWKLIEEEQPIPIAASDSNVTEISRARELRELRLSQPTTTGGKNMSTLSLDGVELSNLPDEARNRIQSIVDENQRLSRENREGDIDKRIEELKGIGFADRPGALKLYRQCMLDDDGGVALVMFSDQPEAQRKGVSVIEILDQFIDALKGNDGVQFSDQHFESGNDKRPPKDASGEKPPLEDRVAASRTALYGDKDKRRTGRK